MRKKVLIMTGSYLPGVKGGGPIQSIKNLVNNLSYRIEFYIVTSDRDVGDNKPFPDVKTDEWLEVGEAKVLYTDVSNLTVNKTRDILNSINFDVLYLNSFFSFKFSIVPIILKKFNQLSNKTIVLAPRGEFSSGALNLKNRKKKFFLKISKTMGLYKNITWHASAYQEKEDIEKIFGEDNNIYVAKNLTANYKELNYDKVIKKKKGELKIVFISRVHPKKNLKKALEFLNYVDGKVEFNIYGPIEDKLYWSECEKKIAHLPQNIKVLYKGLVEHDQIISIFKKHHILLFPTLGENFGHVISEALIGGCPVIISNQTPWIGLEEKNIGWDIKLKDEVNFVNALQYCVNMDNEEYKFMSKKAFHFGRENSNNQEEIEKNFYLFTL
ncbi:glycosyltransferase family 4 protein [Alteribacillus sp. JSM 102045]|uniref:glycosyltransferase family 4 protein n=1 Tax=Alteribacillus sp. JSM 102045 TaxID=1562101 RepID=UPI0035C090F7